VAGHYRLHLALLVSLDVNRRQITHKHAHPVHVVLQHFLPTLL
jgi:hypothetical protein